MAVPGPTLVSISFSSCERIAFSLYLFNFVSHTMGVLYNAVKFRQISGNKKNCMRVAKFRQPSMLRDRAGFLAHVDYFP